MSEDFSGRSIELDPDDPEDQDIDLMAQLDINEDDPPDAEADVA
jgi:hypothetical protein